MTLPRASRAITATTLALLACTAGVPTAFAGEPNTAEERARALYVEGRQHALEGRCAEALPMLKESYELAPSPNSGLLIARCLRDAGELEQALAAYDAAGAAADARGHSAPGGERYAETGKAAHAEAAELRSQLGTLRVHVPGAPAGTVVSTPRTNAVIGAGGAVDLAHRPESVVVKIRLPTGGVITRQAAVTRGEVTLVEAVPSDASAADSGAAVPAHTEPDR